MKELEKICYGYGICPSSVNLRKFNTARTLKTHLKRIKKGAMDEYKTNLEEYLVENDFKLCKTYVKPKRNLDDITIIPQIRKRTVNKKTRPILGWDTETYKGKAELISNSFGDWKLIKSFDDVLDMFFTRMKRRKNSKKQNQFYSKFLNFFWHLGFDAPAMFKWLGRKGLSDLYWLGKTIHKDYLITYIPAKKVTIKHLKRNSSVVFWDACQFWNYNKLDTAAEKYLGMKKTGHDVSNLRKSDFRPDNKEFIDYCINDSVLCQLLAKKFVNEYCVKWFGYQPLSYFSTAGLSAQYFLKTCKIPTLKHVPYEALRLAYASYNGGRFELLSRGTFEKCFVYDIKSAYPHEMTKIIDWQDGDWVPTRSFEENADYGFYSIECAFFNDKPFLPIKRGDGLVLFPKGFVKSVVTQEEMRQLVKSDDVAYLHILDAWVFYGKSKRLIFKDTIKHLYNERLKLKAKGSDMQLFPKILMNSIYGKTIQVVNEKTGLLFNPIVASVITANVRLKVHNFGLKHGWENIIGFQTDSVITDKKLPIPPTNKLGEFAPETEGRGIFVLSGVYHIDSPKKPKRKFRGLSKGNLKMILEANQKKKIIPLFYKRPVHMAEALLHIYKRSPDQINIWTWFLKKVDINCDTKREWPKKFRNAREVLETNQRSVALDLVPNLYPT